MKAPLRVKARKRPALSARERAMMKRNAGDAAALLKTLANRNRLLLLCTLVEEESSVGALATRLALSQSAVSQHLALLRRDGTVEARRDAQTVYYRLRDPRVAALIETLYAQFCG
ncbi:MAG: metalloregulator ArsR/SmtB family transcription factor [Rudaea sp.]